MLELLLKMTAPLMLDILEYQRACVELITSLNPY
jgi:hypothetical protein